MNDITTFTHEYTDRGETYEGYVALPPGSPQKVVLVCHAWAGLADYEKTKADRIAREFGYAAFAIDVYGKGKRGSSLQENEALMMPLVNDRPELQARLRAGIEAAKGLANVDTSARAAIGYCFGGLGVLDMARAQMDIEGVASFHGLFFPAPNIEKPQISARVIAYHGWDDPMAEPEAAAGFTKEMSAAGADWQLHAFGNTLHSFTNPAAADESRGTIYSADADRRSWAGLKMFLDELLR